MKLTAVSTQIVLCADTRIFKTERFVRETSRVSAMDSFVDVLTSAILKNYSALRVQLNFDVATLTDCFRIDADGGNESFLFRFGKGLSVDGIGEKDIVFFAYLQSEQITRRNDQRIATFLKENPTFDAEVSRDKTFVSERDFDKLYILTLNDGVNFPLLNNEQRKIVALEDKNVLVQGVAGSGKTNLCIDRIVFAALRNYSGKVLYSTYSRGLLTDTKQKTEKFVGNMLRFVEAYADGQVQFVSKDKKKAIENRLGVYFTADTADGICNEILAAANYLKNKVDYCLVEDLYKREFGAATDIADEYFFTHTYIKNVKDHQLNAKLNKVKYLSYEIIYKEIYGLIFGSYDVENPQPMLAKEQYILARNSSFSREECEVIYSLAQDYARFIAKSGMTDNNFMSRRLLEHLHGVEYSLAILDEVQDMTEVNLCLMKSLARKVFAVGDALQMINPACFGFAYLKRLLFEKEVALVAELKNNYRNTKKIESIIDGLSALNTAAFGVHSFVLKGRSVDSDVPTQTTYVVGDGFVEEIAKRKPDNLTLVVVGQRDKDNLRKILPTQEILTVSEIKGLERDSVVLVNVLSSNVDKWKDLERMRINRKSADENSVYRYYFNLFYVGVSRAKANLYVYEKETVPLFAELFEKNMERVGVNDAVDALAKIAGKIEMGDDEIERRVGEFLSLEQYDNARFAAGKIQDDKVRRNTLASIDIEERFVRRGDYRGAGVEYWKKGMYADAERQFELSGDTALITLMRASEGESAKLDGDVAKYLPLVADNPVAEQIILDALKEEVKSKKENLKNINAKLKAIKESNNG